MYNYKIITIFVRPEMPKAQANKTGFIIMIVYFYIHRKLKNHALYASANTQFSMNNK